MLKCEILDVQGFFPALHGMRNPKNSWDKSDSEYNVDWIDDSVWPHVSGHDDVIIGANDLGLMQRLFKAGTEHRKYDRMITVWMDITAPLYWWSEFDTYKVGTVANSTSKMHKIHAKEITIDDFSVEHFNNINRELMEGIIGYLNYHRDKFNNTKDKEHWYQMIQLLPSSYNQKRTVMMNYEVCARIIEQRSHHKLDEWHQLVDVLHQLPYLDAMMGFDNK